jgi:hypothetical protein
MEWPLFIIVKGLSIRSYLKKKAPSGPIQPGNIKAGGAVGSQKTLGRKPFFSESSDCRKLIGTVSPGSTGLGSTKPSRTKSVGRSKAYKAAGKGGLQDQGASLPKSIGDCLSLDAHSPTIQSSPPLL